MRPLILILLLLISYPVYSVTYYACSQGTTGEYPNSSTPQAAANGYCSQFLSDLISGSYPDAIQDFCAYEASTNSCKIGYKYSPTSNLRITPATLTSQSCPSPVGPDALPFDTYNDESQQCDCSDPNYNPINVPTGPQPLVGCFYDPPCPAEGTLLGTCQVNINNAGLTDITNPDFTGHICIENDQGSQCCGVEGDGLIDGITNLIYTGDRSSAGHEVSSCNNPDDDDDDDFFPDRDGDGVADDTDSFPDDPTETTDTDNDGVGDNKDPDADNDGTSDDEDDFPTDPNEDTDTDADGVGDNADVDDDNDGEPDSTDSDSNGNGILDIHEGDGNGDGQADGDCDPTTDPDCGLANQSASSSNCGTPPSCHGDVHLCAIIQQLYKNRCSSDVFHDNDCEAEFRCKLSDPVLCKIHELNYTEYCNDKISKEDEDIFDDFMNPSSQQYQQVDSGQNWEGGQNIEGSVIDISEDFQLDKTKFSLPSDVQEILTIDLTFVQLEIDLFEFYKLVDLLGYFLLISSTVFSYRVVSEVHI